MQRPLVSWAVIGVTAVALGCVDVPDRAFDRRLADAGPASEAGVPGDATPRLDGADRRDATTDRDGAGPADGADATVMPTDSEALDARGTDEGSPDAGPPDAGPPGAPPPGPCQAVERAGAGVGGAEALRIDSIYRGDLEITRRVDATGDVTVERLQYDVQGRVVRVDRYPHAVGGRLVDPYETETTTWQPGRSRTEVSGGDHDLPTFVTTWYDGEDLALRRQTAYGGLVVRRSVVDYAPGTITWRLYVIQDDRPDFAALTGAEPPVPDERRTRSLDARGLPVSEIVERGDQVVANWRFTYDCWTCDPERCAFAAPEEICDGADQDADGAVDEGQTNACGGCGEVPAEVFDGRDNDCDGEIDEGVAGTCPGAGPFVCRDARGECTVGTQTCVDERFSACGGVGPVGETCNGLDDDCDGLVDEGVVTACGDCREPTDETCDGTDEDCDGVVDQVAACNCPVPIAHAQMCWGRRPACVYGVNLPEDSPATTCDTFCSQMGGICESARAAQASCIDPNRPDCAVEGRTLTCDCVLMR